MDTAPPLSQNFLDVFGLPVMNFQGTYVNGSPVGTGLLILPTLFATVPVQLGVNASGEPQDTWSGGIQINGYHFNVTSGTLDQSGLHWVGDLGVAGQGVAFNLMLTSGGSVSGTFNGNLTIAGWRLTDASLVFNGSQITGSASLGIGPLSATTVQLREQGNNLEGQGTFTVDGVTLSKVEFQLNGQGTFIGYGEVDAGPATLWSTISVTSSPFAIQIGGSGNFALNAGWSYSSSIFSVSGNASLTGDLNWGGGWNGSTMDWFVGTDNDRACVTGSFSFGKLSADLNLPCVTVSPGTAALNPSSGTFSIPLSVSLPLGLGTITIDPTFPLPSGINGFQNLPPGITGLGYSPITPPPVTFPPTTVATEIPSANAAVWFDTPVSVTLTVTDASSPVTMTEYSLDGGPWTVYSGPIAISPAKDGTRCCTSRPTRRNNRGPSKASALKST